MKRTAPLRRYTGLRRVSDRRLAMLRTYWTRRARFLELHPYCQVWCALHGVDETAVIADRGWVRLPSGSWARAPRSTSIHHRGKRRGRMLLDEREWLAVCRISHALVERHKGWARHMGFLKPF